MRQKVPIFHKIDTFKVQLHQIGKIFLNSVKSPELDYDGPNRDQKDEFPMIHNVFVHHRSEHDIHETKGTDISQNRHIQRAIAPNW